MNDLTLEIIKKKITEDPLTGTRHTRSAPCRSTAPRASVPVDPIRREPAPALPGVADKIAPEVEPARAPRLPAVRHG